MASAHDFVAALARTNKAIKEIKAITDEAYGAKTLSKSQIRRIAAKVKKGEDAKDRRGGSARKKRTPGFIEAVEAKVNEDRRVTIRQLALEFEVSNWTIDAVLHTDLGLSKRCARWVPRLLTSEHKEKRMSCATAFLSAIRKQSKAYLDTVVTTDESWVSFSTPETKEQSKQWVAKGSKPPVKALKTFSEKKVMIIPFFDSKGLIYTHYVPKGQTINADYFITVLKTFLRALRERRPHKWSIGWVLHMDNARPHTANKTMDFLASKNITLVPHPPYSPDLAPADFWLFPEAKKRLAGSSFNTVTDVKNG